jgi:hypothetical protein
LAAGRFESRGDDLQAELAKDGITSQLFNV